MKRWLAVGLLLVSLFAFGACGVVEIATGALAMQAALTDVAESVEQNDISGMKEAYDKLLLEWEGFGANVQEQFPELHGKIDEQLNLVKEQLDNPALDPEAAQKSIEQLDGMLLELIQLN